MLDVAQPGRPADAAAASSISLDCAPVSSPTGHLRSDRTGQRIRSGNGRSGDRGRGLRPDDRDLPGRGGVGRDDQGGRPPERTTSVAAGAVWGLVRVGPPERVLDWGRAGLEALSKLAAEPGTGVRMVSGKEVSRTPLEPYYWTDSCRA